MRRADGFEVYSDRGGKWRWRLWRKGRKIAVSGEGYEHVGKCQAAVRSVRAFAASAPTVKRSLGEILREA